MWIGTKANQSKLPKQIAVEAAFRKPCFPGIFPPAHVLQEHTRKQPFFVNTGEGNVMRMAGLFDVWTAGNDSAPLYTYTILTTDSSKRLAWYVHKLLM